MKKSAPEYFIKFVSILIIAVLLRQWYIDIVNYPNLYSDVTLYESFGISDWLINYQGGFVRRGLFGELLYQIYQVCPFSVVDLIIAISVVSLIVLFVVCLWLFRKMDWPVWLLLFPMFFYYSFYGLGSGAIGSRRDAIMLLLAVLLYMTLKKCMTHHNRTYLVLWGLTVLIMLLHEGMLFPVFPILIVFSWYYYKSLSLKGKILQLLLLWWPFPVMLIFVSQFHGSLQTAEAIWNSWKPLFESYPLQGTPSTMGLGVEGLLMPLGEAVNMCLNLSWRTNFVGKVPIWPFNIYLLLAIYYLLTQMGMFSTGKLKLDAVQMSNIVILQTFFTLPLLGFIACDWLRFIPYYCILSCFLCYTFQDHDLFPKWLNSVSMKTQEFFSHSKFFSCPWTYCVVLIFLPLLYHNARIGGILPFIPLDLKHELLEMLVRL